MQKTIDGTTSPAASEEAGQLDACYCDCIFTRQGIVISYLYTIVYHNTLTCEDVVTVDLTIVQEGICLIGIP